MVWVEADWSAEFATGVALIVLWAWEEGSRSDQEGSPSCAFWGGVCVGPVRVNPESASDAWVVGGVVCGKWLGVYGSVICDVDHECLCVVNLFVYWAVGTVFFPGVFSALLDPSGARSANSAGGAVLR